MGAAVSTNVSDQISSISNSISQNTVVNQTQINNTSSAINLTACNITAGQNVNMSILNNNIQTSKQLVTATQNSTVTNDIQQKLLQAANSTVGSLGLGYAEASNASSQMANTSTNISNAMNVASNQISITSSDINCTNSTITAQGSVAFSIGSNANFISDQTVSNTQITNVANRIAQSAQQKASATVEGIAAGLIAIALIIAAIGYSTGKTGNTSAIKIIIIVLIVGILVFMYIRECPPFFDKDLDCVIGGRNGSTVYDSTNCVDVVTASTTTLTQPPLRYLLPIIDVNNRPNLCQVLISTVGNGTNNNGYNMYVAKQLYHYSLPYQTILGDGNKNFGTSNVDLFVLSQPKMITNFDPFTTSKQDIGIPSQFRVDMGNGTSGTSINRAAGSCTPGFLMWEDPTTKWTDGSAVNDTCSHFNKAGSYASSNCYIDPNTATIGSDLTGDKGEMGSCPRSAYVDQSIGPPGTDIQNMAWLDIAGIQSILYPTDITTSTYTQMTMRFVLCSIINSVAGDDMFPLNIYINPKEYVTIPIVDKFGNTYNITNTADFMSSIIIDPSGTQIKIKQNNQHPVNDITLTYDPSGNCNSLNADDTTTISFVNGVTSQKLINFSFTELSHLKNKLIQFQPTNGVCGTDFNLPCVGTPGTLNAQTGKVKNNSYHFHKISNTVLISIVGLFVLYLVFSSFFGSSNPNAKTADGKDASGHSSTGHVSQSPSGNTNHSPSVHK